MSEGASALFTLEGVTVRRFPAVVSTPRAERAAYENAIHNGWPLTIDDQQRWMNDDVRSPELFHHLLDHAGEYRALLFAPYLFWVTFAGSQIAPDRSILWACVHDEPYLRLELFEPMFAGVAGLWFQAEPEHELAHQVLPRLAPHRVVGCGMQVPTAYDPDGFRKRHGIEGRFILYAGRREGGLFQERTTAERVRRGVSHGESSIEGEALLRRDVRKRALLTQDTLCTASGQSLRCSAPVRLAATR